MSESEYLYRLEDDLSDALNRRVRNERHAVTTPDTANDMPLNEAVAKMREISA